MIISGRILLITFQTEVIEKIKSYFNTFPLKIVQIVIKCGKNLIQPGRLQ